MQEIYQTGNNDDRVISMKMLRFDMEILDEAEGYFRHRIMHEGKRTEILYNPANHDLVFLKDDPVTQKLKMNIGQIQKIFHTKRTDTFYPGFRLKFILMDRKKVSLFNDMSKVIVLDRRMGREQISILNEGIDGIHEIYTDASFLESKNKSGMAVIVKYPDGKYLLDQIAGVADNNCLAELEAVVKGLEMIGRTEMIRLITDSRYVRKGLTEWMFYWRLNNWLTANAEPAKNIEQWKAVDRLTAGKYIEVAWIKGHSGNFENTMCDLYARDAAEQA